MASVGAGTLLWAYLLARLARERDWRKPLTAVTAANAGAAAAIVTLAVVAPTLAARLLLAAVAVEVGALAAVQLHALRGR